MKKYTAELVKQSRYNTAKATLEGLGAKNVQRDTTTKTLVHFETTAQRKKLGKFLITEYSDKDILAVTSADEPIEVTIPEDVPEEKTVPKLNLRKELINLGITLCIMAGLAILISFK